MQENHRHLCSTLLVINFHPQDPSTKDKNNIFSAPIRADRLLERDLDLAPENVPENVEALLVARFFGYCGATRCVHRCYSRERYVGDWEVFWRRGREISW